MAVVGDLDEFEVVVLDACVDGGGAGVEAVHPSSISTAIGSRKAPAPFKTSDRTNTGNDGDGDIVTDRHKRGGGDGQWSTQDDRLWPIDGGGNRLTQWCGRLMYMDVVDVVGDLVEFDSPRTRPVLFLR
ncbi:hypothetical protein RHSIM_Rhsim04G0152200 [Rhododendron simsii]|uniref:Uncharacterized protein n=1 Tax=Rhododendron simsii TaxID=118357 RepID=A0A834H7U9_RHOSS|nr:hypothetical protein RHSIM_Rhsim04G0152200 [Rhododendron simsii]